MNPLHIGFDAAGRSLYLDPEDRKTHMHVIGSSGSGKSKFLEWMMRGDLDNGQGFCLLDPHGTLYEDVLNYCAHRIPRKDIILLNLSQPESIIGFNPFQRSGDGDVMVQVERRIAATMHAWDIPNTDKTPTLERTLRLIFTVMLEMNLGLPQVAHLINFSAEEIRSHLVDQLRSPLIQQEWRELQALRVREWREELMSAKNKLFRFLTSPTLGRFIGVQGRTLDLLDIMNSGKILLVNLAASDHLSHENARVFGSLLVNEFFECALRRKRPQSNEIPTPYYLYMDEFQNFVSIDIADMLDEVRKFGLFQVLSHQRFGQLNSQKGQDLVDAVLTNCKIKAVFGGLPVPSAKLMAEELFIGELDAKKIKAAIYQTKFWPMYQRDKVYSSASSRSSGSSSGESSGSGFGVSASSGEFYQGVDWFGSSAGMAHSTNNAESSFSFSGSGYSTSESFSETEGVSDIPIFVPVPFQELSSIQYYTMDEQLTELTAALKEQFGRHAFIKIQNNKTQPMLVPFVQSYYTKQENRTWYCQRQLSKHNALSLAEVDELLQSQESALLKLANQPQNKPSHTETGNSEKRAAPSKASRRAKSARASIFANLGSDLIEEP